MFSCVCKGLKSFLFVILLESACQGVFRIKAAFALVVNEFHHFVRKLAKEMNPSNEVPSLSKLIANISQMFLSIQKLHISFSHFCANFFDVGACQVIYDINQRIQLIECFITRCNITMHKYRPFLALMVKIKDELQQIMSFS